MYEIIHFKLVEVDVYRRLFSYSHEDCLVITMTYIMVYFIPRVILTPSL